MIATEQVEAARAVNMVELASRYTTLQRASGDEYHGPCPKCGGEDRFVCEPRGWFCRQCRPMDAAYGWHGPIDFVMWQSGLSFPDAVGFLVGGVADAPQAKTPPVRKAAPRQERPADWRPRAERLVAEAQAALWRGEDERGRAYLERRGLESHVWRAFGLGYGLAFNRDSGSEQPAIVMPWYRGGNLTAVRYRFLATVGKQKTTSLRGSLFGGLLYGGQAMSDWGGLPAEGEADARRLRTLVLCEGEINAMSIWQVAAESNVDVLSLGSESAKLTDPAIAVARLYGRVIVWMDRAEVVRDVIAQIPGAFGLNSPAAEGGGEVDANDLLRLGKLGAFLTAARWQAARTPDDRKRMVWDLFDVANGVQGLDGGTARMLLKAAGQIGVAVDVYEAEPGRWITRRFR